MAANPKNSDLNDVQTVWLPETLIDANWNNLSVLVKNVSFNSLSDWYPWSGSAHGDRAHMLVVNSTPNPIIVTQFEAVHGYVTGHPVVLDENNNRLSLDKATKKPVPAITKLKSTIDRWIDPAPQGMDSFAVFTVDGHSPSTNGVLGAIEITVQDGADVIRLSSGVSQGRLFRAQEMNGTIEVNDSSTFATFMSVLDYKNPIDDTYSSSGDVYNACKLDCWFERARSLVRVKPYP